MVIVALILSQLCSLPGMASATAATQVYAVEDFDRLSIDQRLLLVSIQGLVNREGPILWLRSGPGQTPGGQYWEATFAGLQAQRRLSYEATLARFARSPYATGVVIVDPAIEETYNIATNLAGQENLLIVTPSTLGAIALPVRHDLRGRYRDEAEANADNFALYRSANHEMAFKTIPWSARDFLFKAPERGRDLVIQRRYWSFTKPVNDPDLVRFYTEELGEVRTLFGSTLDENLDVYRASEAGKMWLGMDLQLQYNLSFFVRLPGDPNYVYAQPPSPVRPTAREPGSAEIQVAFLMTEGDNPFFVLNQMRVNWANRQRGQIPIGWTIPPRMHDLMPAVLQYYYQTATPNDYFVAGASGIGYYHLNPMDFARYPELLQQETPRLLRQLDLQIIRNFGDWLGVQMSFADRLSTTAAAYPELLGWVEGHGIPIPADGALPYERATAMQVDGRYLDIPFSAWCDNDADVPRTVASIRAFAEAHPERPLQIMVGLDQKSATPSTAMAIAAQLGDGYRFVRPDVLFKSRPARVSASGPQQLTPTSVLLSWETDEFVSGTVTLQSGGGQRVGVASRPAMKHELTIGDLAPATTYTYRLELRDADGNITRSGPHTFATPERPAAPSRARLVLRALATGLVVAIFALSAVIAQRRRTVE
jgi:hypothetical protein